MWKFKYRFMMYAAVVTYNKWLWKKAYSYGYKNTTGRTITREEIADIFDTFDQ